jgi:hypothetical protein
MLKKIIFNYKMKNAIFLFAIIGICFVHGALSAQWARVPCPFLPNTLTVHDGYIFEGSDRGVARSKDGKLWEITNSNLHGELSPSPVLSFCSVGNTLIAGADYTEGLFVSTDDGDLWLRIHDADSPEGVVFFSLHDNYIFAASDNGTVTRSSDSGMTWIKVDSGFTESPFGFNGIALASSGNFVFFGNNAGQIYRTSNNGVSWDLVFQNATPAIFYSIAVNGSSLFAQMQDTVWRSVDNGDTWQVSHTKFGGNTFITLNNTIFDGGYYGVIYSPDNGDHWNTANDGLPALAIIDAFAIKDGYLYAGANSTSHDTTGGLWRRPLGDLVSAVPEKISEKDITITLSPNPTNGIIAVHNAPENTRRITLINILGETVIDVTNPETSNFTLDLSKLPPGIYNARFVTPNSVTVKKIIRE